VLLHLALNICGVRVHFWFLKCAELPLLEAISELLETPITAHDTLWTRGSSEELSKHMLTSAACSNKGKLAGGMYDIAVGGPMSPLLSVLELYACRTWFFGLPCLWESSIWL